MKLIKINFKKRDTEKYKEVKSLKNLKPHPLFKIITGEIERWEKIQN